MVASTKRISFGFQCEEFDDDIFTKQLADTLERFERDIKRKCNKFSIARGTYNYTKAEIDHTQYMAVDEVYCAVDGGKITINNCDYYLLFMSAVSPSKDYFFFFGTHHIHRVFRSK